MKNFIVILLLYSLCGYGQETNLNVRVNFKPGITHEEAKNIDLIIKILIDNTKVSEADISSYPASIIQSIPNPQHKDIYFKVKILRPPGWAVTENPVKYNKYNRKITLRRLDDVFFILKERGEKSQESGDNLSAIETYNYILDNNLFSSENQKLEIIRNKAALQINAKYYQKAMEEYVSIAKQIDLSKIGKKRKAVYINEFFNSILKVGKYNQLNSPKENFPDIIKEDDLIDLDTWLIFSKAFNLVYPAAAIKLLPKDDLLIKEDVIKTQFNIVAQKLNSFKM